MSVKMKRVRKYVLAVIVIGVLAAGCELFIFNFKYWDSMRDKPLELSEEQIVLEGITKTGNGYRFHSDSAAIEITDIDRKIGYLYFCPYGREEKAAEIQISAKDEANSQYLPAPTRHVHAKVKPSQYIRLHFSGKVKSLKIWFSNMAGETLRTSDLVLNVKVPLMFSAVRAGLLALALCLVCLLRQGSFVWRYTAADMNKNVRKIAVLAVIAVCAALFWQMIRWNTTALGWYQNMDHHRQYYDLIDAFEHGRLDVGEAVKELAELENPYDKGSRDAADLFFQSRWDHAYFEGKYYVYFGVVPAVLMYWPYHAVTGKDLPNYLCVYFLGIMIMVGIAFLLWQIIRKWFRKIPFILYLILIIVFGAVSCLGYAVYKPDFYIVPLMTAIMFGIYGLGFWISAEQETAGGKMLVPWRLAAGSLCIALIAGCRPQQLLVTGIGVILFWQNCFRERLLFSKKSIRQTAAVCIPFAVVACFIMWYNFARFGSPFDFGANYNLTTNDMTSRGFVWGRTMLAIFSFLLQPPDINAVFPFLHDFGVQTTYQGLTLSEQMIGGVYWLFPILLMGIYGIFHKKWGKDRRTYRIVVYSELTAVVLAVLDAQMAGLLTRYFLDFVWIAMIGTVFSIFGICQYAADKRNREEQKRIRRVTVILSCISLVMVFLRIFAHSEDSVQAANPALYYTVRHLIAFWM